ncbi:hypothetical protein HMI56_005774 [Coelomomyces lativittatus]|nr:hypothetical protein HMI56_005774 [Coelomomyces lativittatus]
MELINSLKTSIEEYKAKNVLIANAYAAKGIPIAPTLVQHLQQSNTKLLKDQQAINTFIKEGTQGLLKGLKIQLNDHSILLVNLISLKLKWLRSAALEEKEMAFTFRDPKKPKAMTPFAIHNLKNVPYFDKGGIKACTIPFMDEKGATNPSLNSLSAYIIQHDQGSLSMDKVWPMVFNELKKTDHVLSLKVFLPRFRVRGKIQLTGNHLPQVLRMGGIQDFKSFDIPKESYGHYRLVLP